MANMRCPMCGKSNPSELEECQFCGARLKPAQGAKPQAGKPIKPGDQPIKRDTAEFEKVKLPDAGTIHAGDAPTPKDTGELERALPSWLRSVRQGEEAAEADTPAAPPAEERPPAAPAPAPDSDWLSGLGRAASEPDELVPDWLAGLRTGGDAGSGGPGGQPEETESSLGSGNADWLSRLGGEPKAEPQSQPSATLPIPSPSVEKSPDRLQSLKSESASSDLSPADSPAGEETPDWLSGLSSIPAATNAAPPVKPEAAVPAEKIPDWMAGLEPKPETSPTAAADGVPGWLSDLEDKAGTGSGAPAGGAFDTAESAPASASAETPGWLSQMKADFNSAEEAQEPKDEYQPAAKSPSQEKGTGPLPDWLSGVDRPGPASPDSAAAFGSEEGVPPVQENQAAFSMENPDWLSQLKPEKRAEGEGEVSQENLEAGELPSWVQAMRPVEAVVGEAKSPPPEEAQNAETSGPLAGLQGVIPTGPGLGVLRKPPSYSSKLQVSENQQKYASFLERMVMEEADAKEPGARRMGSSRLWRWLIAGLLIAAISLPLLTTQTIAPDWPLSSADKGATTTLIDGLPAGAPVLIAFDYDPALSGELEAVAAPVIDHLLARGPRLSVISTNPAGLVLADHFFQNTPLVDIYQYTSDQQYANLGYLPGGPAGVSDFATDPHGAIQTNVEGASIWDTSFLQGVTKLSDFGAIIILTDNADTGRAWIEQTSQAIGGTPLLMIVSAQAQPMLQPYFDSGQIQGLVTGLVDAKIYEQGYARPGSANGYWDSLSVGVLAAELLIAGGAMWSAFAGWQARRNKAGEESLTMPAFFTIDFVVGLISFLLTLMVLSYLIGDNPAFRVAVYMFVGVSAGYAASVAFWQVLWPKLIDPLVNGGHLEQLLLVIPFVMGFLLWMRLSARTARLGTVSLAYMTGVGAAVAIGGAVVGTILPQTRAAVNAFDFSNSGNLWLEHLLDAVVMLVGTVATLAYFHFGAKATGDVPERGKLVKGLGWVGQIFIAGTFGVLFAGVLTASLTALIQRWSAIITFILSLSKSL